MLRGLQIARSMHYYAVKSGLNPGIYATWDECKANTQGVSHSEFKKFGTMKDALEYLKESYPFIIKAKPTLPFTIGDISENVSQYPIDNAASSLISSTSAAYEGVRLEFSSDPSSPANSDEECKLPKKRSRTRSKLNLPSTERSSKATQTVEIKKINQAMQTNDLQQTFTMHQSTPTETASLNPSVEPVVTEEDRKTTNKDEASQPKANSKKRFYKIHTVYCDGAARGNPGHGGLGFAVYSPNRELVETGSHYIGSNTTNNEAEYLALIMALEKCLEKGIEEVRVYLDSDLVVKQVSKVWRTKNPRMIMLVEQVDQLKSQFKYFKVSHIPRDLNSVADNLANKAIDQRSGMESVSQ